MDDWIIRVLPPLILFGIIWLGLWLFWTKCIDKEEAITWLSKKLSFVKEDLRKKLFYIGWQPLLAVALTWLLFNSFDIYGLSLWFRDQCFRPKPKFLYLPVNPDDLLDSLPPKLVLETWDEEIKALNKFVNDERKFLWWWLNGKGGSGTQRLVEEWLNMQQKSSITCPNCGSDVGFLRDVKDMDFLNTWQSRKPTLIVVDDAAERSDTILNLLKILGSRADQLKYTVRVLLVERTPPESLKSLALF
ncbi:MAG: hypothetical protein HYW01_05885 [Deltaproteobacteria bacterium]|nr:hypothetical protein [Deltaproteobacteria bacterium]